MLSLASNLRIVAVRSVPVSVRSLRILAADPVDASCGATFTDAGHKLTEKKMKEAELLVAIPQYEGLVVRSGVKVTAEIIAAGKKLRIIGRAGAGVDNIDCEAATRAGVLVMNTPGGNTSAAAELTMSLLMSMARSIPQASAALKVSRCVSPSQARIAPRSDSPPPPRHPSLTPTGGPLGAQAVLNGHRTKGQDRRRHRTRSDRPRSLAALQGARHDPPWLRPLHDS